MAVPAMAPTWFVQVGSHSESSLERLLAEAKGASQERMKREITTFFQEVARIRPVLLFFDDLHWADASTIDVLAYVADRCRALRLLIVATYRPGYLQLTGHAFLQVKLELQARGACREIPLDFLTRQDIEDYLAMAFPRHRFPTEFAALIHRRTEGNPLFMVDLLHYLRDPNACCSARIRHCAGVERGTGRVGSGHAGRGRRGDRENPGKPATAPVDWCGSIVP